MTSRTSTSLACVTTALATISMAHPARGHDGEPRDYYSYYKTAIPLILDTQRIAVMAPAVPGDGGLAAILAPDGMAPDDVLARPLNGWFTISTPATARSDPGTRTLVRELASRAAIQFVSPVFTDENGWPLMITPDLLVAFAPEVPAEAAEAILHVAGAGKIIDRNYARMDGVYRLRTSFTNGFDVLDTANTLAQRREVRFAEPDLIVTGVFGGSIPNDGQFFRCWGLHSVGQNIFADYSDSLCQELLGLNCDETPTAIPDWDMDAPEAWNVTTGDPSIIAVVFDGGVQLNHPDLLIDASLGMDFTGDGGGGNPLDVCHNHGTLVAGALGARMDNSIGGTGVAPTCSLASARFAQGHPPDANGDCPGTFSIPQSAIINALDWAQTIGARITNHSYGINVPAALEVKFSQTRDAGIIHFAAAGNDGQPLIWNPSGLPTVNSVAATGFLVEDLAPFSNFGEGLAFCAPGGLIYVTDRTGDDGEHSGFGDPALDDYKFATGTSFASPYAAGVAALVLSVDPTLTPRQVEGIMAVSAVDLGDPGYDTRFGWGLVNAAGAVALAACPWDVDGSGDVGVTDFLELLAAWGGGAFGPPDIDGDDTVGVTDFLALLANWGPCP